MFIAGYNCMTSAGTGFENLMAALYSGKDGSISVNPDGGKVCFLKNRTLESTSFKEEMVCSLTALWKTVSSQLNPHLQKNLTTARVGFIFCSTKGCVEDYVWKTSLPFSANPDPYSPIVDEFIKKNSSVSWAFSCTISNACSSSHIGLEYAQEIFTNNQLDYILVAAADLVGPFIYNGFQSLKVLTSSQNKSFAHDRNGLQLGDGLGVVLLSKTQQSGMSLEIKCVASETEGALITKPSPNGDGLLRALNRIKYFNAHVLQADLVIAHGTGTLFNDLTEDLALQNFFSIKNNFIPVTGTKWCVGHTLGASGVIDLIAGCEVIKNQKLFALKNTEVIDLNFKMNYLTSKNIMNFEASHIKNIVITSLGFGGVHAALWLTHTKAASL